MKTRKFIAAVTALVLVGGVYPVAAKTNVISNTFAVDGASETKDFGGKVGETTAEESAEAEKTEETTSEEAIETIGAKAEETTAESEVVKDGIRYTLSNGKAIVKGLEDTSITEAVIPDEVDGCPVVEIGEKAFYSALIRSAVLGKNVTDIDAYAFMYCIELEKVTLNDGLVNIKDGAFFQCGNLKEIKTGSKLETIGVGAFGCCYTLHDVELGENVKEIGGSAFNCTNVEILELPESVEVINNLFGESGAVTSYKICNTLIVKNPDSKLNTTSSESDILIVCDEDSNIMGQAKRGGFRCCTPEQYEKGEYEKREIPALDFLACMSKYGMDFCETDGGLEVVRILNQKNGTVTIPDEVGGIPVVKCELADAEDENHITLKKHIKDETGKGEYIVSPTINPVIVDHIEKVVIGKNVKTIGEGTFAKCENLKSVEGGENVEVIGDLAFAKLDKLEGFEFSDKLKDIGYGAFLGCDSIKELVLPDSIEKIGDVAFGFCHGLTSVKFPEKDFEFGGSVFCECLNLTSVKLPADLKKLGRSAFYNCQRLKNVELNEGLEEIGAKAFMRCVSLSEIKLPSTLTAIEDNTFNGKNISTLAIPQNVKSVGKEAFIYFSGDFRFSDTGEKITVPKADNVIVKVYNPDCEVDIEAFSDEVIVNGYAESALMKKSTLKNIMIFGDANCDGALDMSDVVLIMQSLANPDKYGIDGDNAVHMTNWGVLSADVEGNGNGITVNDALKIQKYLLGQEMFS